MTIAHPEPAAAVLPAVTGADYPGLQGLDQWLTAAGHASQLAERLVDSFFVPQAYKPQNRDGRDQAIANATGAILLGQSLGLDPLTALQQIYVVHGRPGMYAKMKVALAQARGHRVWDEEYTAQSVTVCGQRAGSSDVVRITITMADAERAGWAQQNANYKKTPADMLWARAASRVVDRIAADVLFGLSSIEDLADEPEPAPRVTARVSEADLLKARPVPALAAAPESKPSIVGENPETPQVEAITDAQLRKLGAVMGDLGVTGTGSRERRLAVASHVVGRDLASSKDLTKDEARGLIDALEGRGQAILAELEPQADPVEDVRAHAADVEQQIAQARAAADENAQAAADEAQADEIDPTDGSDPWAGAEQA